MKWFEWTLYNHENTTCRILPRQKWSQVDAWGLKSKALQTLRSVLQTLNEKATQTHVNVHVWMEKMRFHDRGAFKLEEGTRVTYHLHRLRVPKFRLEIIWFAPLIRLSFKSLLFPLLNGFRILCSRSFPHKFNCWMLLHERYQPDCLLCKWQAPLVAHKWLLGSG